jgi:hypothetical protein
MKGSLNRRSVVPGRLILLQVQVQVKSNRSPAARSRKEGWAMEIKLTKCQPPGLNPCLTGLAQSIVQEA